MRPLAKRSGRRHGLRLPLGGSAGCHQSPGRRAILFLIRSLKPRLFTSTVFCFVRVSGGDFQGTLRPNTEARRNMAKRSLLDGDLAWLAGFFPPLPSKSDEPLWRSGSGLPLLVMRCGCESFTTSSIANVSETWFSESHDDWLFLQIRDPPPQPLARTCLVKRLCVLLGGIPEGI